MQRVFVLSNDRRPLDPCRPARARKLLKASRAAVFRHYPFTIILKDRTAEKSVTHSHRLKVDPGSRKTGLAIVQEESREVAWAGELHHRGEHIKRKMLARRQQRRGRRHRNRYRPARFNNRAASRRKGHLPPSLQSRVENIVTWVGRLRSFCPIEGLSLELAKFDTQKLQNPEISGVEYQQGELVGYEVREYLLEKWYRKCAYCGADSEPLEIEHIIPRIRGGSNRVSNLTLSCAPCNRDKGSLTAEEYGHPEIQKLARKPLKDAAVLNATRWAIFNRLHDTNLPLETGTGARTKYNRTRQDYLKAHWIDAACVGETGANVRIPEGCYPLSIKAMGSGSRQMVRMDRFGFPRTSAKRSRRINGFLTGDFVYAKVPAGKHAGVHRGRLAIRSSGKFRVGEADGLV